MEKSNTIAGTPPFEGVFLSSPEESFPNHLHAQRELSSTPNVSTRPLHTMNLESSENSSNTDSGYCSLTPLSADSLGRIVDKKCHICSSHNYSSTPNIWSTQNCTCQRNCSYDNQPLNLEYLEPISESRLSTTQPNSFLVKRKGTIDLYDDAMDSSLYETDVDQPVPGCSQEFILSSMEIGEEKSIDFTDSGVGLPNTSGLANTTKSLNKLYSEDHKNEMDSDEFFSPEATGFLYNEIASPKERNEANHKNVKTSGTFYSVASNICSISRFLRSFNLNGIDKVDFLYQLGVKKNCPGIISTIFDFLADKDLDAVRVVSKTWNQLFLSDVKAYNRWDLYKTTAKMKRENCYSPVSNNI